MMRRAGFFTYLFFVKRFGIRRGSFCFGGEIFIDLGPRRYPSIFFFADFLRGGAFSGSFSTTCIFLGSDWRLSLRVLFANDKGGGGRRTEGICQESN